MNHRLALLFHNLRAQGFTASQAAAYWNEVHILASPILFALSSLRKSASMRAVSLAHAQLSACVLGVKTPSQWEDYCNDMPLLIRQIQEAVSQRWTGVDNAVRDHWPVLAMDEGLTEYGKRSTMGHVMPSCCDKTSTWDDLLQKVENRYALDVLCDQVVLPKQTARRSWQRVMAQTGLRSIRWSFGDDPGSAQNQDRLRSVLLHAQSLLRSGLGWKGPVLGLAGRTSIALTDRGKSDGMVQPDPGGTGQTMTLGHWSVLAHEWMHTLDIMLARHYDCKQAWATHAALEWDEEAPPPVPLMAWFWQVGCVLGGEPPSRLLPVIGKEIAQWPDRVRSSLGMSLSIQEEIARQQSRIARKAWTPSDSQEGWVRALNEHGALPKATQTAYLLSRDMEFALDVETGAAQGYWSEYIARLRALIDPPADLPLLPSPSPDPIRYLTNAVEVMARSFEVSLAHGRAPGLVWVASMDRPNAGLVWPTPTEAQFQGVGWKATLAALRPLWKQWKAT